MSNRKRHTQHRHDRTLRMLHGRVCATSDDRLYLVTGTPDADNLFGAMLAKWPLEQLPDLSLLESAGFRRRDIREVTPQELSRISRTLSKVRKFPSSRDRGAFDRYERRFREIEEWHRRLKAGERDHESPLWLPESEDKEVERLTAESLGDGFLPGVAELARGVAWLENVAAARRFLTCVSPEIPPRAAWAEHHDWKMLLAELESVRRRFPTNSGRFRGSVRTALSAALARFPDAFRETHNITPPSRDMFALTTLDSLLKRARAAVAGRIDPPSRRMLAAVAALCSNDGATTPPSSAIFAYSIATFNNGSKWRNYEPFVKLIIDILRERGQRGYEQLLRLFDEVATPLSGEDLPTCRRILVAGGNAADVAWLQSHDLLHAWRSKELAPTPFRELVTAFEERNGWFGSDGLTSMCDSIRTRRDLAPYALATRWLKLFPNNAIDVATIRKFQSTFAIAATATMLREQLRSFIPQWIVPPKNMSAIDLPTASPELKRWLKQLAWYQRLAGDEPKPPQAVRKAASAASRVAAELEWMHGQRAVGHWNDFLEQRRRNLLERVGVPSDVNSAKLVRTTARAAAVAGVRILEQKLGEFSTAWWQSRFGAAGGDLRHRDRTEICGWIGRVEDNEATLFNDIVAAWKSDGPAFKNKLAFNRDWIEQAKATGIILEAWLQPRGRRIRLDGGGEYEIRIEADPFHMFLMGTHFETCLSLCSGFNHRSVLANTAHANKAVLYVRDRDGAVVARKLLAISTDGELIGYHTYCHLTHGRPRRRLIEAVERFCGALAAELRIPLTDEGEPEELGDHFWYDDEPMEWSSLAHWSRQFPSPVTPDLDRLQSATPRAAEFAPQPRKAGLLA